MSETVIKVENLSKYYRLGVINHGVFYKDVQSFIAKIRGKEDPNLKIDQKNNKNGWIKALDNISFDVKQGEILGIIGSNGAGKSTLLKILSRVTAPSKGTIKIKGRIGSLLEVGTGFHPELTGRENIFLNGAILGMKKREIAKKLDEIIDFSGVEKFIDTPVKRYSSGMYVRLAFAVAAHLEPEILVVDEVLAVGDAEFQKKCLGKMGDVAKEGRTVLFVSHNMGAVKKLCQKGILLKNGKIEKSGKIKDVVDDYYLKKHISSLENFKPISSDDFSLINISFLDKNGKNLTTISTDTDIYINVFYELFTRKQLNLVLNILKGDEFVFQSINNFDPMFYYEKEPGTYISECFIPKHFFNNGTFVLELTFFEKGYSNPVVFKDVLSFNVEDSPDLRGDYFGGWLGCVRPVFTWKTKKK